MQKVFSELKEEVQTRVQLKSMKVEVLVPITFTVELAKQIEIPIYDNFSIIGDVKKVQTVDEYDRELSLDKKKKVTLEVRNIRVNGELFNPYYIASEAERNITILE